MGELFGRYRLEELIGRGGMGEVHRAVDTSKDRLVAVKRLPVELAQDATYRERFRRESELAARLDHPHVIPIYEYGEIDGHLFIEMRLVRGADLATIIAGTRGLEPERAVRLVAQTAAALDAAHAIGLIHRDVKPSNILVTAPDRSGGEFSYLVDFGIARITGGGPVGAPLTVTGDAVGTAAYMAPERIGGGPSDHRVDVYALACVLFETLTGRRPFAHDDLPALVHAHLTADVTPVSELRPDLPHALDDVIARGMARDPDDRYGHASELARDATTALRSGVAPYRRTVVDEPEAPHRTASLPSATSSPDVAVETPRSRRPAGRVVAAAVVLAATLTAVVAVAVVRSGRGEDPAAAPAPPVAPAVTLATGTSRVRDVAGPRACDVLAPETLPALGLGGSTLDSAPGEDGGCRWQSTGGDTLSIAVDVTGSTIVALDDSVSITVGGMPAERHIARYSPTQRYCVVSVQVETQATMKTVGPLRSPDLPEAETCAQVIAAANEAARRVR